MKSRILIIISCLFLLSCGPKNEAVNVGNKFVNLYYQQMNQQEALKLSSMMAKEKLEKEYDLVRESRIKNPQPPENRAKVTYKLEDSKLEKDMGFLTYKLTIQPTGAAPFDRTALITIQNENNVWSVINFEELNRAE
jgi:hypothetical protein